MTLFDNFLSCYLLLCGLAAMNILLSWVRHRTVFNITTLYWVPWLMTVLGAKYAELKGLWLMQTHPETYSLIAEANIGAFAGLVIGTMLFGRIRAEYSIISCHMQGVEPFLRQTLRYWLPILFVLSLVAFFERLSQLGFSIFFMRDVRNLHFNSGTTFIGRIAVYASVISLFYYILMGLSDSLRGRPNFTRIIYLVLAGLPLALARGSRLELFIGLFFYGLSFYSVLQLRSRFGSRTNYKFIRRFVSRFVPYMCVGLLVFALVGMWRVEGTRKSQGVGNFFQNNVVVHTFDSIVAWFGSSVPAVYPLVTEAEGLPLGYGRDFFSMPTKILERVNLLPGWRESEIFFHREDIRSRYATIGYVPGTKIPHLVRDFGRTLLPWSMGLLMFMCVVITSVIPRFTVTTHMLVLLAFREAIYSAQNMVGLHSATFYLLILALIFDYMMKRNSYGWFSYQAAFHNHQNRI